MKKRWFLLLALLVMLSAIILPTQVRAEEVASGSCGDGLSWVLDDGGVLTIYGSGNMSAYAEGERPWEAYNQQILELVIEAGVSSISDGAFASCSALTYIHFAGNAPAFGADVFAGVTATAYYPAGDNTWTEEVKQNYGGTIAWEAHCEHQWQDATCTTPKSCTVCGTTEGEPTGHSYKEEITEPTCTEQGYTTHTCDCGDSYVDTYTEPKGHTYEPVTVEPTCTEQGYTGQACTACSDVIKESYTDPKGHSHEAVVTEPTCTEQGYTTHTCACGDSYVDTYTAPKGHSYEAATVEATCTKPGFVGQICSVCGHELVETYTEEPKGHSYEDVTREMTCTEPYFVGQVCSVCGDTVTQEYEEAPGHKEVVDPGKEPTCTEGGISEGSHCDVCQEVLVAQEELPAKGHADANKDYICDVCRKDLCTKHSAKTIRGKAATCEKNGMTDGKKCSKCGDILVAQEVIPALGHDWQDATCTAPKSCAVCGITEGDVLEHSFGPWTGVKAPTVDETGLTQRVCAHCGHTEEKILDKLDPPVTQPPTEPVQTMPQPTGGNTVQLPNDNRNPTLLIVAVAGLAGSFAGILVLLLGRKKEK